MRERTITLLVTAGLKGWAHTKYKVHVPSHITFAEGGQIIHVCHEGIIRNLLHSIMKWAHTLATLYKNWAPVRD